MRIDKWLHINGYFDSRSKAKEAIKRGIVRVNGRVVKPSYQLRGDEEITILEEGKPKGYFKLRDLDEEWGVLKEGDVVLDIGSSAGGFVIYACEKAKLVIGIEISSEFEKELRRIAEEKGNVRIIMEDAFKVDINELPEFDVILCDLTLEPKIALKALMRFVGKLKRDGKVLFVSKSEEAAIPNCFEVLNLKKADKKREWYYLLRKNE